MTDVAQSAAPTAATEATSTKPAAGSPELIAYHAKEAAKSALADAQAAASAEASAKGEVGEAEAAKERGPDGKFLPKKGAETKAKEAPKEAPAEPSEEPEKPEPIAAGGLGQARKLVREGNIAKALELIGLSPEKLEGRQWGAFRQRERAAAERERQAMARTQEIDHVANQLAQKYERFERGMKAFQSEDYDEAIRLVFNADANEIARKRVHAMQTKDPEVVALKKMIQERDQRDAERERVALVERERAELAQKQRAYVQALPDKILELGDERFAAVANKRAFVRTIFNAQYEAHHAGTPLSLAEAAEQAWEDLYDGVAGEVQPRTTVAATTSKATGATKNPVRQAAKATTSLNTREAAEAAPATKLQPGSPELLAYYARKAELDALGLNTG